MLAEELNDAFEVFKTPHAEFLPLAVIPHDGTTAKDVDKLLQYAFVTFMLDHTELWKNLPSHRHCRLTVNGYMKAAFAIDEPDDPCGV